jgi:hypothetical protein
VGEVNNTQFVIVMYGHCLATLLNIKLDRCKASIQCCNSRVCTCICTIIVRTVSESAHMFAQ